MKKSLRNLLFSLFVATLFLSAACKRTDSRDDSVQQNSVCPMGNIPTETSLIDEDTKTYPLPVDFMTEFLKHARQYEGTQVHLNATLPDQWHLLYREPLPASQELWLVRSEDKDWMYLLITAGDHIRDAVPVGVDIASTGTIIESERWTWKRDESGAFIVNKHYEKRPDFRDTTQRQCEIDAVDRYLVGTSGLFECTQMNISEGPAYQLVILYNTSATLPVSWEDVVNELEPYCEENGIFFVTLTSPSDDFRHVEVQDYEMNYITTVDISSLVQMDDQGLVFLQNGQEQQTLNYSDNARFLQMKIRNYFQINNNINL